MAMIEPASGRPGASAASQRPTGSPAIVSCSRLPKFACTSAPTWKIAPPRSSARDAVPELPRAWLTEELPADWIDRCRELGCIALDADHRLVDESVVRAAHAAHLRVAVWTVNDPERAAQLTRWGVDCVITDAVDRIAP